MAKKKVAKKTAEKKTTKKTKTAQTAAGDGDEDDPDAPVKKKRKTRKKKAEEVRRKLYWGVFNHAMKRVALYEYNQRKAADKKAEELSPEGKPPHFVQKVKEDMIGETVADAADADAKPAKKKSAKK